VRVLAWMVLLAWMVACGKQGAPMRHSPQPRQATGPTTLTQPTLQEPKPTEPATVVEEPDPGAAAEPEVKP
jgi:hypothetical protein